LVFGRLSVLVQIEAIVSLQVPLEKITSLLIALIRQI
jgi:hypothetical protein